MLKITHFSNIRTAQVFVDYMATQKVTLVMEEQDGFYVIFLKDASKKEIVEQSLSHYVRNPNSEKYLNASWQRGNLRHQIKPARSASFWPSITNRAGPLTLTMVVLVIAVFIYINLFNAQNLLAVLEWPTNPSQRLEIWRWFGFIVLQVTLMSVVFNLFWWWYLGGMVEKQLGTGKLIVITLISALLTGWMQVKLGSYAYGLQGVVYALIGYCWLMGHRAPKAGIYLENGMLGIAVIFLVLGYYGVLGSQKLMAPNIVGLVLGLAMALVDSMTIARNRSKS